MTAAGGRADGDEALAGMSYARHLRREHRSANLDYKFGGVCC